MNSFLSSIIKLTESLPLYVVFMVLGGIGTFLYGLSLMSTSLKSLAGGKLKAIVSKATSNVFGAFMIGVLVTVAIQSSGATTVIAVSLIAAGLLNLKQALPIMIGAHVGTTITAYIVGANIGMIAFPLIFISSLLALIFTGRKINLSARVIAGLAFLFFGLDFMSVGFGQISHYAFFEHIMMALSSVPFLGFITGIILTALIQSSSAFIGIVQELYVAEQSTMSLLVAFSLVIGSNIGTSVVCFIAALSGNRVSKQAAIANVLFAVVGSIVFLPFISLYTPLFVSWESAMFGEKNMFIIAFFHTIYNILNAVIALFIIPLVIKLVEKILPLKNSKDRISAENLTPALLKSPSLALEASRESIIDMAKLTLVCYDKVFDFFEGFNSKSYEEIVKMEDQTDNYEHLIHDFLMKLSEVHLSKDDAHKQTIYIDIIRDLERISDHSMNFAEFFNKVNDDGSKISDRMKEDLLVMFNLVREQIKDTVRAFEFNDTSIAYEIVKRENTIDTMEEDYRHNVHSYNIKGIVNQLDIFFIDCISNLERISDHTTNIAECIIDPHMTKIEEIEASVQKVKDNCAKY